MKKIYLVSVFSILLLSFSFFTAESVLALVRPTITSLVPDKGAPGREVIVNGLAYCSGTKVIFYKDDKGTDRKGSASASPVITYPAAQCVSGPAFPDPQIDTFKFTVPDLASGPYWVGLESKGETSETVKQFTVLSRVTKVSPNAGNHQTLITITGGQFGLSGENQVYFELDDGINVPLGDYLLDIDTALTRELKVKIPRETPIASYFLRVYTDPLKVFDGKESGYQPSSLNRKFILKPYLNNLIPNSGARDELFAIEGIYFPNDTDKIKIRFYQGVAKKAEIPPLSVLQGAAVSTLGAKVPSLPNGSYSVKVAVQDAASTTNWIESGNALPLWFTVSGGPVPDFVPQGLFPSGDITVGSSKVFSGLIKNQGNGGAEPSKARFCVNNSNCLTATAGRIGEDQSISSLPADGSQYIESASWLADKLGSYTIWLCADVEKKVFESDENNNCTSTKIKVTSEPSPVTLPSVTTLAATDIGTNQAKLKGNLTNLGGAPSVQVWFKWGTSPGSYPNTTPIESKNTTGSFNGLITGLSLDTTYYFKAMAQNSAGTAEGVEEKSFTTGPPGGVITTCSGQPCPPGAICNPLCAETFEELINAIINFIFWIAVAIAPLLIIIGGFYFVAAAGDAKKIETGKRIILYTLIGLLIILISRGLVEVIKGLIKVVD